MRVKKLILFLVPLFVFIACGDKDDHDHDEGAHEEHAHAAKHGGDLIPLGDHEGFIEVKLDHDAGTLSLWAYMGEEMSSASLDSAPLLNLRTDAGPKQLIGKRSGNTWVFADASLKGEPESARFRIVLGGKSYSPAWDHHHGDDHESHEGHDHD